MVDVEHRGLAALKQHRFVGIQRVVELERGITHHGAQALGIRHELGDHLVGRDGATVVNLDEKVILDLKGALHLLAQDSLVEDVLYANAHAINLVGVGGADSATGGANLALTQEAFGHLVERAVVARNEVRVSAHAKARDVDASRRESRDFAKEHLEINDHAVRNHGRHAGREDARGQQVKGVLLVANDHGVAGIVAAVELDHVVDTAGQEVGGLALTLVAPLGAHENDCWHDDSPRR